MELSTKEVSSILTPQRQGFLSVGPYPFTHTLSSYVGCSFGQTTCGMYCYAQFLPNWRFSNLSAPWGMAVQAKTNAPALLEKTLSSMKPEARQRMRIFMSSTTDPYQPIEKRYLLTRQCLEVFARYPDLDLLVVQTRSPLAERDLPLLQQIPYAYLSVTIETDDEAYLRHFKGGPPLAKRWLLVEQASSSNIHTQIAVSPCLPYTSVSDFAQKLLSSGAHRIIIDTFTDGDGTDGARTARTPYAQNEPDWRNPAPARALYNYLTKHTTSIPIGWSSAGFAGIPHRVPFIKPSPATSSACNCIPTSDQ